jgi:hypothetical protein
VALVLVGVAAGAFLVGPAMAGVAQAPIEPAATARWANCPGVGFGAAVYDDYYRTSGPSGRYGESTFLCPLSLPHRARVTAVRFHLRDESPLFALSGCYVSRSTLEPPTGAVQHLAGPLGTGVDASPGYVVREDSSIQFPRVNNREYAYHAECTIAGGNLASVGILGVSVRYVP